MNNEYGKKERYSILARQLIYLLILITTTTLSIVYITQKITVLSIFILPLLSIIALCLFLHSLVLSCKIYQYKGKTIVVYAGYWNHYLKIDNILLDEYKNFTKWFTIYLSGTDNGDIFEAKITNLGKITLKINNKLYYKQK